MSRCTGHCCQGFSCPSIEWLQENHGKVNRSGEGLILLRMLVPRGPSALERPATEDTRWIYDCRHFDIPTGNCRIYPDRPDMCRDYPYDRSCDLGDCTFVPADRLVSDRQKCSPSVAEDQQHADASADSEAPC